MEFGSQTIHTIERIYSSKFTRILVNNELTNVVPIFKGIHQSCPLSPLLFVLSLEVLLYQMRNHPHLNVLKIRGLHYNLQAVTDDLMIILEPVDSISVLSQCLDL